MFPLTKHYTHQFTTHHLILINNTTHTIHPLTKQKINLNFINTTKLITKLKQLHHQKKNIKQYIYLHQYKHNHKHNTTLILTNIQKFHNLFSNTNPTKKLLHNINLKLTNTLPNIKPQLIHQTIKLNNLPK